MINLNSANQTTTFGRVANPSAAAGPLSKVILITKTPNAGKGLLQGIINLTRTQPDDFSVKKFKGGIKLIARSGQNATELAKKVCASKGLNIKKTGITVWTV